MKQIIYIIIFTIAAILGNLLLSMFTSEPIQVTKNSSMNVMSDVDMDCGDSYYDSIPEYSSFNDVPASVDTVIRVDGILYKKNNNKTSWIPTYQDEYVMWVGDNGDTIWE